MSRKPKKTTGAKRRGRAAVAGRKKKARSVLVSARKPRGAALAEALAPIFERLQFLDESVRNLWQMRDQMNALSKEVGDAKYELGKVLETPRASQVALEELEKKTAGDLAALRQNVSGFMNAEHSYSVQTRQMVETLAVNTFDKIQEIKDAK